MRGGWDRGIGGVCFVCLFCLFVCFVLFCFCFVFFFLGGGQYKCQQQNLLNELKKYIVARNKKEVHCLNLYT